MWKLVYIGGFQIYLPHFPPLLLSFFLCFRILLQKKYYSQVQYIKQTKTELFSFHVGGWSLTDLLTTVLSVWYHRHL